MTSPYQPQLPPQPNQARPPFVNGSQGGTVKVGSVTQPTRSPGKAAPSLLNGASGNAYVGGGPQQPVRHVASKGKPLG